MNRIFSNVFLSIIAVILICCCGCFHNPVSSGNEVGDRYELFKMIWEDYESSYPEFTVKNIDWAELFYQYSPLAEQAETTEELVMEVLLPMLSELKDAHIKIYKPNGDFVRTYLPEIQFNVNDSVLVDNYLLPNEFTGWDGDIGYCNPDSLPYLAIQKWSYDLNVQAIQTFLGLAADKPAVIIDIRMNSGGSNMLCGTVAGMFTDHMSPAWRTRYRNGPGYDDVIYHIVNTHAHGGVYYGGTVYLLVGGLVASSSEDFTLHMNNFKNVILLGDTTMGAVCHPNTIDLADGWQVNTIDWSARTVDHEPVEGCGIAPDICVEVTEEDFAQGIDPVLEYAIELVESQSE